MQYRKNPKSGDELSILGFGCMRFPKDETETERLVLNAIENGINYFDTAYIYPGSEAALGRILAKNKLRDSISIATKLPPFLVRKADDAERILNVSLERLQTNWIDYYLIHMLPDANEWERLKMLGLPEWISKKKQTGKVKNIGFSYHGGSREFIDLLDVYDWDFCMIQYNYMDEHTQAGKKGLDAAAKKGLPVMIMEPLRGGRLATGLPKEALAIFDEFQIKRSPAEWSFRWIWNQPEVITVLSGMNSISGLTENLNAASEAQAGMLSDSELFVIDRVKHVMLNKTLVPCTGCGYCMPCPSGVDIPQCFDAYNSKTTGAVKAKLNYALRANNKNAGLCIECGKCEIHCPQRIEIRRQLHAVRRAMEGPVYTIARFFINRFMGKKTKA